MESHDASKLHIKQREISWIYWVKSIGLVCQNCIINTTEHCNGICLNCQGLVKYLGSFEGSDPEFLFVFFQLRESSHGNEVMLKVEILLVFDFLNQIIFFLLVFFLYDEAIILFATLFVLLNFK